MQIVPEMNELEVMQDHKIEKSKDVIFSINDRKKFLADWQ